MAILTEAIAPIKALARQARSYSGSVARAGIRTANIITKDALGHGMKYYAAGGAVLGGAAGGYNAYSSGDGVVGGTLKGAALGAAGGAALRMGMSGGAGRRSMRALGMRMRGGVGGGMSGAAARAAGSTNYFRSMAGDFERAGGFGAMSGGARAGYGRARSAVMAGANRVGRMGAAETASKMAGRVHGSVRGAYGWASGIAGDMASKYTDMGKYYAGL